MSPHKLDLPALRIDKLWHQCKLRSQDMNQRHNTSLLRAAIMLLAKDTCSLTEIYISNRRGST